MDDFDNDGKYEAFALIGSMTDYDSETEMVDGHIWFVNSDGAEMFDAGMGLGFTFGLTCIGVLRELLGAGQLFGFQVLPASYIPNNLVILPPFALILLGCIIWVHRALDKDLQED